MLLVSMWQFMDRVNINIRSLRTSLRDMVADRSIRERPREAGNYADTDDGCCRITVSASRACTTLRLDSVHIGQCGLRQHKMERPTKSTGIEDLREGRHEDANKGLAAPHASERDLGPSGANSNPAVPRTDAAPVVPADHSNGDSPARPWRTGMHSR